MATPTAWPGVAEPLHSFQPPPPWAGGAGAPAPPPPPRPGDGGGDDSPRSMCLSDIIVGSPLRGDAQRGRLRPRRGRRRGRREESIAEPPLLDWSRPTVAAAAARSGAASPPAAAEPPPRRVDVREVTRRLHDTSCQHRRLFHRRLRKSYCAAAAGGGAAARRLTAPEQSNISLRLHNEGMQNREDKRLELRAKYLHKPERQQLSREVVDEAATRLSRPVRRCFERDHTKLVDKLCGDDPRKRSRYLLRTRRVPESERSLVTDRLYCSLERHRNTKFADAGGRGPRPLRF